MKKSEVETHYEHGRRNPAVNVKHHLWFPDLFRDYEGTGTHEYSDDAGFWAWMHEVYDDQLDEYNSRIDSADEWAREACWEDAQTLAEECWPTRSVIVYSEGRSGGWAVVHNLPDIEEWDAIALGRWARFAKGVEAIAHEEYPYQFVWNLAVHVFEPIREERRNAYPAPAYT